MFPEFEVLRYLTARLRAAWAAARENGEGGYSTEAVIVTALLAAAAIIVIGIIVRKVRNAAESIRTQ